MAPARFEPAIPASERPQTHALDRAATRGGLLIYIAPVINGLPEDICFEPEKIRKFTKKMKLHCCVDSTLSCILVKAQGGD